MRVPADALLGGVEGQGFIQMMRELPRELLIIGVQGVCRLGALDVTLDYMSRSARPSGRPWRNFRTRASPWPSRH